MEVLSLAVEAVAALGNKVVETLRTQDPAEGDLYHTVTFVFM
jgi:hypothetical protein